MLSTKIWLEANTERSESNPGRSLGTITMKRRAVWKTVPHDKLIANIMNYIAPSPYGSVRTRSKRSRITPMRRICSFTDFYCVLFNFMRLSGAMIITDYLLLAVIPRRIGANAIRSKSNIKW